MTLSAHHLRMFEAVSLEKSFSRAALSMQTSHASVKRIIEELEKKLGFKLLECIARGTYEPTSQGRKLLEGASSFLREMNGFQGLIKGYEQLGKTLRIGAKVGFYETDHFTSIFHHLSNSAAYRASCMKVNTGEGKYALESGQCDILIGPQLPQSRRLQHYQLPLASRNVAVEEGQGEEPAECPPLYAVFLAQHPYGNLQQVIYGAVCEMNRIHKPYHLAA